MLCLQYLGIDLLFYTKVYNKVLVSCIRHRERFLLLRARGLLLPGGQGRLSFMGHSAGAIIIRAALTNKILVPALKHMHMFVSLGSPHLGTIYGASGIVRTGMWAMKRYCDGYEKVL